MKLYLALAHKDATSRKQGKKTSRARNSLPSGRAPTAVESAGRARKAARAAIAIEISGEWRPSHFSKSSNVDTIRNPALELANYEKYLRLSKCSRSMSSPSSNPPPSLENPVPNPLHLLQSLLCRARDGDDGLAAVVAFGNEPRADDLQRVDIMHRVAQGDFDVEELVTHFG